MATDDDRQLVWIALAVVALLVVLPALTMGFGMMGYGSMMGGMWGNGPWSAGDGTPGWLPLVGVGMQLLFLAVVGGAVYLGYRALVGKGSTDPALEELRAAYARGELSDEEYERRRERLEGER